MRPPPAVAEGPPPPSGLPPPRPPGLPSTRDERSRAVRFEPGQPKLRSLSCDDVLRARATPGDFEGDDDAPSTQPSGGHVAGHHIQVTVRCRPLHHQEAMAGARPIIKVVESGTVVLEDPQTTAADDYLRINKSKERRYDFDEAFSEFTPTKQVYETSVRGLIDGLIQGFNSTVFAYGATGAGKTHTMLGSPSEPGIMMLTLLDLFSKVSAQKEDRHFEVKCSFMEVYNENVRDLLNPDADYLDIREDPVKGVCIAGISEVGGLESAREIMALLHQGNKNRTTEATGANVTSSRSHAVLQVVVEQRDRTAGIVAQVNVGKLSMIDLAGSERASQTNNKGLRMIEGANINRSLLALGNCITALSSNVAFVPYRDSKMTRLLKDSLGGNCRTAMIANVSPSHFNYEDTHNTLKYAKRASSIKTKAVRNVVREHSHVSKYTEIIKDLKSEISQLKSKLLEDTPGPTPEPRAPYDNDDMEADLQVVPTSPAIGVDVHCEKWKQELMQNFEERVRLKRRLIDLAQEAQGQQVQKSHAQVGISQWESNFIQNKDDRETPSNIRDLQERLQILKMELARTDDTTQDLEMQLRENQQQAERLHAELPARVKNKDMQSFLGLVSRIYVMEVENMDLREMNDVTEPLLQQKDLEAEALRLQIQMRDRVIEEQNQLLMDEGIEPLAKRDDWMEIPGHLVRHVATPFNYEQYGREETREAPSSGDDHDDAFDPRVVKVASVGGRGNQRSGGASSRARSQPPPDGRGARGVVVLPPLSPASDRRRGVPPPTQSYAPEEAYSAVRQQRRVRPVRGLSPLLHGANAGGQAGGSSSSRANGRQGSKHGVGGPSAGPAAPSASADLADWPRQPLDIAGRGLGQPALPPQSGTPPPPGPAPGPSRTPPVSARLALDVAGRGLGPFDPGGQPHPGSAPGGSRSASDSGGLRGDASAEGWREQELDLDGTRIPGRRPAAGPAGPVGIVVGDSNLAPVGVGQKIGAAPIDGRARQRRNHKKRRRNDAPGLIRDAEHQLAHLHVDASGLQRDQTDEAANSDSEAQGPIGRSVGENSSGAQPAPPRDSRDMAAERKSIIDKLNRKTKPPPGAAGAAAASAAPTPPAKGLH